MTNVRVAAVQATYVLMNREATIDRVAERTAAAAADGAELVVFPEAFVPGTPIWIDTQPIWDGDAEWFRLLAENAVAIPGPATDRLGAIAREHGVWLAIGVQEKEPHGGTIYNTFLYLSPDGQIADKHRKLVPTGSERTVWGMGDGSTLRVVETPFGRIGGLICWENYMPLARFHLYAQGIEVWLAPTLAPGDAWIATMRHHRAGESDVRRRREPRFARRLDPERLSGPRSRGRPPAGSRKRVPGSRRATRSSSDRAARSWPARHVNARRR